MTYEQEANPIVHLRPWTAADEPLLGYWFEHAEVPEYLAPRLLQEVRRDKVGPAWIAIRNEHTRLFAVLEDDDNPQPIGVGSLHTASPYTIELGLIIGESRVWGQGYGRAATIALVAEAFADPQCARVVARVQGDNALAADCCRTVGFEGGARGTDDQPAWLVLTRTAWRAHLNPTNA